MASHLRNTGSGTGTGRNTGSGSGTGRNTGSGSNFEALSRSSYESGGNYGSYGNNGNYGSYYPQGASRKKGPRVGVVIAIILVIVLVAAAGAAAFAGYTLYTSAKSVKASAKEVIEQASTLKKAIKSGDADALDATVSDIKDKVDYIYEETHTTLWDVATFIPVYGEDITTAQTLGDVAHDLTYDALVPIANVVSGKGVSDLIHDKTVDVGLLQSISSVLNEAMPTINSSLSTIASLPEAHLDQVQSIIDKIQEPAAEVSPYLDEITEILDVLPQMLGADGQTRTYLVIAQNNSELRETGGLPGAWGTLVVTDGAISMGDFTTILHWPGLLVDATAEELEASGSDMNVDPAQVNCIADFPRVGYLAAEFWSQAGYGAVDGVVAMDPVFLQWLLELVDGVVSMADGTVIDGTNAAQTLMSNVYWNYGSDGEAQDAYFAAAAATAFDEVMSKIGKASLSDLQDLAEKASVDRRVFAWMVNDDEEALVEKLGFDGAVGTDPAEPELGVYLHDETWSKIDWYASVKTTIGEGVANSDGTTTYGVVTTITNNLTSALAEAAPTYIRGSNPAKRDVSDMLTCFVFYAPAGGTISDMQVTGGLTRITAECTLNGLQIVRIHISDLAGETTTFAYNVTVSAAATEALALRTTALAHES